MAKRSVDGERVSGNISDGFLSEDFRCGKRKRPSQWDERLLLKTEPAIRKRS